MKSTPLTDKKLFGLIALILSQANVMRWGHDDLTRDQIKKLEESVLSHVGGMHAIACVLKKLELAELSTIKWGLVHDLITIHDLPEVECGDKVHKTDADRIEEKQAETCIKVELESFGRVGQAIAADMGLYSEQNPKGCKTSLEARLVKIIDEIHGLIKLLVSERPDFNYKDHKAERSARVLWDQGCEKTFPRLFRFGQYLIDRRTQEYEAAK